MDYNNEIKAFDDRRDLIVPGDREQTYAFCAEHFIETALKAIAERGFFTVALSGGSTPKGIINLLKTPENRKRLDWNKILFFWSDERAVPPTHKESNYHMAMEAGLADLEIPQTNIFRMMAESDIEANAIAYEKEILEKIPDGRFDLMMLGMGDDGHTASLFPFTHALKSKGHLAVANFVPKKDVWRMSLTFECINAARVIVIYILGKDKSMMLKKVLNEPYDLEEFPVQAVGTTKNQALLIVDNDAAIDIH